MSILTFPSGPLSTNTYIVYCPVSLKAAVIDAAPDSAAAIVKAIEIHKLIPEKLLLTHSHWDHIADAHALATRYSLEVAIHALDLPNLESPGSDGLSYWITIPAVQPSQLLKEGDCITIGMLNFTVLETPGHTPGGVCFYEAAQQILFSGDTLFKGSIGILSLPTARPHLMWPSLKKLALLPGDTKVFPGHGPSTTIGAEAWLSNAESHFG